MSALRRIYGAAPIHWKLTAWSALLLFVLFLAGAVTQYAFVEQWMLREEKQRVQQEMRELLNLLLAKEVPVEPEHYDTIRDYLHKANTRNGMIGIIDQSGEPLLVAADNMPQQWLTDKRPPVGGVAAMYKQDGMLVMRSPLTIFGFQGEIEIVRSLADMERLVSAFYEVILWCCLAAVLLSALGGRLLSRVLIKPLRAMNETMRKVKQNGLRERMPVSGAKDDIAALSDMFNRMMDQVERSFDQQKRFVEDASHELRTPISVLEGHVKLLQRWGKNDPAVLEGSLAVSMEELARLKVLVEELLALSRAEQLGDQLAAEARCERPADTIVGVVSNVGMIHPQFHLATKLDALTAVQLAISERHLEQILLILLDNAVKYSGESRQIVVAAEIGDDCAEITVTDYGVGIDERDLPHVWDRFYRADKARSAPGGYGLGLSIARQLAGGYKGTVRLDSKSGQGTVARLSLPLYLDPAK